MSEDTFIGVPDDQDVITEETFMDLLNMLPSTYRRPKTPFIMQHSVCDRWNAWFEDAHPDWAAQVKDPLERFWKWWNDAGENVHGFQNVYVTRGDGGPGRSLSPQAIERLKELPRWEQSTEMKTFLYQTRILGRTVYTGSIDELNYMPRLDEEKRMKRKLQTDHLFVMEIHNPSHDGLIRTNLPDEKEGPL